MRGKGEWRDRYRAVDKAGQTLDVLLMEHRETAAALRLLTQAIRRHGVPETITRDGHEAHEAAITRDNEAHGTHLISWQVNYVQNMVDQEHRGVTRVTRPMRGFKSFAAAQETLVGIERRQRMKKGHMVVKAGEEGRTAAEPFYALAA